MAPQSWATPEQREFLQSLLSEYEACQVKRRYKNFWLRVNKEFLEKFPIIDKLFPGLKPSQLSDQQKDEYAEAIAKQQKRIKEWYRWQMNPRSRNAGFTITKKDLHTIYHSRTRVLKPYEAFAKLYPQQVEELKKKRCEEGGIRGRQQLSVWHDVAKDLYRNATKEQVEAVRRELNNGPSDAEDDPESPRTYLRYLKKLPTILDAAVSPAVKSAGVLALVTIVGPDPEKNGKIISRTLQFGDKPDTPLFSNVWADHDSVFIEELARFARRHEFPPEVCAARSIYNTVTAPSPNPAQNPDGLEVMDDLDSPEPEQVGASAQAPHGRQSLSESSQIGSIKGREVGGSARATSTSTSVTGRAPVLRLQRGRQVIQDSESEQESETDPDGHIRVESLEKHCKDPLGLFTDDEEEDQLEENEDLSDDDGSINLHLLRTSLSTYELVFSEDDWHAFEATFRPPSKTGSSARPLSKQTFPRSPSLSPKRSLPLEEEAGTNVDRLRQSESSKPGTTPQPPFRKTAILNTGVPSAAHPRPREFDRTSESSSSSSSTSDAPIPQKPFIAGRPKNGSRAEQRTSHTPSSLPLSSMEDSTLSKSFAQLKSLYRSSFPQSLTPPPASISALTPQLACDGMFRPNSRKSLQTGVFLSLDSGDEYDARLNTSPDPSQKVISPSGKLPESPPVQPTRPSDPSSVEPPPFVAQHALGAQAQALNLSRSPSPLDLSDPGRAIIPNSTPSPTSPNRHCIVSSVQPTASSKEGVGSRNGTPSQEPRTSSRDSPRTGEAGVTSGTADVHLDSPEPPRRRSARGTIPSRREELLQLIGTNAPRVFLKKPGSSEAWFTAALDYLSSYDLGGQWVTLVEKWASLERLLGQGKIARVRFFGTNLNIELNAHKGSLPTTDRPPEWVQWTSKAWQGNRPYDKVPPIDDPADIGLAITHWWASIQPPFRASDDLMPLDVYSAPDTVEGDPWSHLRKSGCNGFVSVIMLLVWWGYAAVNETSEWLEDSKPLWNRMVIDVTRVVEEMTRTFVEASSAKVAKRPATKQRKDERTSKKKCD
ncbi:hypothetical protein NMY22_g17154 [Coprinellus aureogranulatus]|nr:hypothetical protein NMY22_g17154 [Coprinellus aureogranulatus]